MLNSESAATSSLNDIKGLECQEPQGAFYAFPSCKGVFGTTCPEGREIRDDVSFCDYILLQAMIAVVPGRAFGLPGHFRLAYAYAMSDLIDGVDRIAKAVSILR